MISTSCRCSAPSEPPSPSSRSCENPRMELSGVRSSCDMLARNSALCWLARFSSALTASRRAVCSVERWKRWASWMAVAAGCANSISSSMEFLSRIQRFVEPDLGHADVEVLDQRGGHAVEQLRLEQLAVHPVDRVVEEGESPGALLRLLEKAQVAQSGGQLLAQQLERLLLPPGELAKSLVSAQEEDSAHRALQQDRGAHHDGRLNPRKLSLIAQGRPADGQRPPLLK